MTHKSGNIIYWLLISLLVLPAYSQDKQQWERFTIARLKYDGGGDWYADPSSLPNLLEFAANQTGIPCAEREAIVEPSSREIFNYPYLYLTGHGRITFSAEDAANLRRHLTAGGFLHVDDNYGLDEHFRREIKKVFPDQVLQEVPFSHEIYHSHFDFPAGPPKIHEHDKKPPQGFGIFYEERMVVYYTYESDLGDGWEDPDVHNDPEAVRLQALRMGTNLVVYALSRFNRSDS
ncbi:DUF4159 domain-containing protein [bacterium]|nr:DUF4159 domain-containing protein [bacterium]MBU1651022.1 DUF4159 domain-containing protein [bacterium]MBU1881919.1 DUF4159 domain-containing protein [bacterium]